MAARAKSVWRGLRSAPSPCTSSTTTSSSRTPGTSAADHLVSGLVPLALLVAAGGLLRPAPRRAHARPSRSSPASSACSAAPRPCTTRERSGRPATTTPGCCRSSPGSCSLGVGAVTLWRSRRRDDRLWWRYGRRALLAVGAAVVAFVVLFPLAISYVVTHAVARRCPAAELGAAHENVAFTTSDGLRLRGWYIPSRNGAAVIAFPGRGELAEAGEAARAPRLRRAALRPPRRGRERGRPEPLRLAGRARHPRGGRVPAGPSRRRSGADRRHRPLGRRRDDDRGRGGVERSEGDRHRRSERPLVRDIVANPRLDWQEVIGQRRRHRGDRGLRTTARRPT